MQSFARWVWRIWLNRDFKIFLALKVGFWGFLCCSLRGKVSKMNFLVFFQPTSMRAIRARYDPYLQTRHRVEQVTFSICKKMRIISIPWTGRVQQLNFYFSTVNKLWVLNCPTLTSITPGEFWTSCEIFSVQYLIFNNNNNNNNSEITSFGRIGCEKFLSPILLWSFSSLSPNPLENSPWIQCFVRDFHGLKEIQGILDCFKPEPGTQRILIFQENPLHWVLYLH